MGERYFPQEESRELEAKIYWFFALLVAGLILLLLRAWQLQVVQGEYYTGLSDNNRLRVVEIPPPRGRIYDRNGAILVSNVPAFNLYMVPGDMPDPSEVIASLSQWIDLSAEEIETRLQEKKGDPLRPVKIKKDLSMEEVAKVEGHGLDLPGVKIEAEFKRHAPSGALAAHLLGYVGEISQKQLKMDTYESVKGGDIIGQYGVEQSYDALLRGQAGEKKIEVDVLGHERNLIKTTPPRRGDDIYLSLDLRLQKVAENALGGRPGAIVALNPNNGEILAMVSHPSFDPNLLSKGVSSKAWRALLENKERPLTNRVIHGQYPPGSIFKIILSAGLLTTGLAEASDEILCKGFVRFGKRTFRDWKRGGHGEVNMRRSLVESCDVYYYEMGRELGVDAIARFARLFGLGSPTGIDLAFEKKGLIPTKKWKKSTLKEPWYPGETLSVSIGQGYVSATPLQLVSMIGALANDGYWYTPHLLKKNRKSLSGVFVDAEPRESRELPIPKEALETIREALAGVVSERHGTASKSRSEQVSIAGKTGTAQVIGRIDNTFDNAVDNLQDHAWFVAFAPVKQAEIAVVVLVEHGGHGGSAAAPLAKILIESYFEQKALPAEPSKHRPEEAPPGGIS